MKQWDKLNKNCVTVTVFLSQGQHGFPSGGVFQRWLLHSLQAAQNRRPCLFRHGGRTAGVRDRRPAAIPAAWCHVWLQPGGHQGSTRYTHAQFVLRTWPQPELCFVFITLKHSSGNLKQTRLELCFDPWLNPSSSAELPINSLSISDLFSSYKTKHESINSDWTCLKLGCSIQSLPLILRWTLPHW